MSIKYLISSIRWVHLKWFDSKLLEFEKIWGKERFESIRFEQPSFFKHSKWLRNSHLANMFTTCDASYRLHSKKQWKCVIFEQHSKLKERRNANYYFWRKLWYATYVIIILFDTIWSFWCVGICPFAKITVL